MGQTKRELRDEVARQAALIEARDETIRQARAREAQLKREEREAHLADLRSGKVDLGSMRMHDGIRIEHRINERPEAVIRLAVDDDEIRALQQWERAERTSRMVLNITNAYQGAFLPVIPRNVISVGGIN